MWIEFDPFNNIKEKRWEITKKLSPNCTVEDAITVVVPERHIGIMLRNMMQVNKRLRLAREHCPKQRRLPLVIHGTNQLLPLPIFPYDAPAQVVPKD